MKRRRATSKSIRALFLSALILTLALSSSCFAGSFDETGSYFFHQLSLLAKFSQLQEAESKSGASEISVVENFLSAVINSDENSSEDKPEKLTAFFQLALNRNGENSSRLIKILQVSGRIEFARSNLVKDNPTEKPFSSHVKEAIKCNKARASFYSRLSAGKTEGLSKLYSSLEYCLIPLATVFDKWAQKFWKMGIPVLKNDFVSMTMIPEPAKDLTHKGSLTKESTKKFKSLLKDYQKKVIKASAKKDFLQIQINSIQALHDLKELEMLDNCNLSLSIHFVESIGLAAKNADRFSREYANKTDNFYRAFIALQTSGIRIFSTIDLRAQAFHKDGIGIIKNDLPAIPFP